MKNSKRLTVAKSFQVCKDFLDLQQNFALIIKCVKMVQFFLKGWSLQRLVWDDSERDFKSGQRSLYWERYPLTWLTNQHVRYKESGVKKMWDCEIALCWSHDAGLRWSQDALIKFCSKEQSVIFCQAVSHSESETHLGSRRQGLQTSTGGTLEWFSWGWNWIIIGKRQSFFYNRNWYEGMFWRALSCWISWSSLSLSVLTPPSLGECLMCGDTVRAQEQSRGGCWWWVGEQWDTRAVSPWTP